MTQSLPIHARVDSQQREECWTLAVDMQRQTTNFCPSPVTRHPSPVESPDRVEGPSLIYLLLDLIPQLLPFFDPATFMTVLLERPAMRAWITLEVGIRSV